MPDPIRVSMHEAAKALGLCAFCGAKSAKLCDGKLPDGSTCSKKLCASHAHCRAFVSASGPGGIRRHDTRDLCPDCVQAKREIAI